MKRLASLIVFAGACLWARRALRHRSLLDIATEVSARNAEVTG